jgi:hypothetical protein
MNQPNEMKISSNHSKFLLKKKGSNVLIYPESFEESPVYYMVRKNGKICTGYDRKNFDYRWSEHIPHDVIMAIYGFDKHLGWECLIMEKAKTVKLPSSENKEYYKALDYVEKRFRDTEKSEEFKEKILNSKKFLPFPN